MYIVHGVIQEDCIKNDVTRKRDAFDVESDRCRAGVVIGSVGTFVLIVILVYLLRPQR